MRTKQKASNAIFNGNIIKQLVFSSKTIKITWKEVGSAPLTPKENIFIKKADVQWHKAERLLGLAVTWSYILRFTLLYRGFHNYSDAWKFGIYVLV